LDFIVVGARAASVLHAQSKPLARARTPGPYLVAELDVKDKDGFGKDFLPKAQANMKEHGGKYLAGGYDKTVGLSGAAPQNRVVLIQFPDMDTAKAFYDKNKPLQDDVGNKYVTSFRIMAIEGVEQK
jgi:uncharacterized protein (DUF1330 family)